VTFKTYYRLAEIAASNIILLRKAITYGAVVIVTNSEIGWVESTCRRFLPSCVSIIDSLTILSARTTFSEIYASPVMWKIMAFHRLKGSYTNILSIGDSECERRAAESLKKEGIYTKSLKLRETPSIGQFTGQLMQLTQLMEWAVTCKKDIDIYLTD